MNAPLHAIGPLALLIFYGSGVLPLATATEPFRFGVSSASLGVLHRNDMTAALKAWGTAVTKDLRLDVRIDVVLYDSESRLSAALADGSVESATMTAEEFVRSGARPEELFMTARNGSCTKQYLLLTRLKSPHHDLASLVGKELALHDGPATSLALPWLDTVLLRQGAKRAQDAFGKLNRLDNPSKCVLRVFFGQSEACLVTAETFQVACELNPQLQTALRPIASSPPLIPTFFFIRPDYQASLRSEIEQALTHIHSSVSGLQLLTVYMATSLERHPSAVFDTTRRLVEEYHRLLLPAEPSPGTRPSP